MKSFDRKSYNSAYYAQNKQKIIMKRRAPRKDQKKIQLKSDDGQHFLFTHPTGNLNRSNGRQHFKLESTLSLALIALVILDSCYLIGEAVEFYRANDLGPGKSVLAVVIVEFMIVALSMIRQSNVTLKVLSKSVLVLLFLLSSWSFCSNAIGKGIGGLDQIELLDEKIERIKTELRQKDALIRENLRLQRITLAGTMTVEKQGHVTDLTRLEDERMKRGAVNPKAQMLNLYSAVGLRLLIQLSNIIILHHVAVIISRSHRRPAPSRNRPVPNAQLMH